MVGPWSFRLSSSYLLPSLSLLLLDISLFDLTAPLLSLTTDLGLGSSHIFVSRTSISPQTNQSSSASLTAELIKPIASFIDTSLVNISAAAVVDLPSLLSSVASSSSL